MKLRSVFERRFSRPVDDHGGELVLKSGEPVLVVEAGRWVGYRCKDGSVWRPPEPPVEEWLRSDWGNSEDEEWIPLPIIRWRR